MKQINEALVSCYMQLMLINALDFSVIHDRCIIIANCEVNNDLEHTTTVIKIPLNAERTETRSCLEYFLDVGCNSLCFVLKSRYSINYLVLIK